MTQLMANAEHALASIVVVWLVWRTLRLWRDRPYGSAQARSLLFLGGLWVLAVGFWVREGSALWR